MISRLARVLFAKVSLERACTCDVRFIDVANDLDCPVHGIASLLGDDGRG